MRAIEFLSFFGVSMDIFMLFEVARAAEAFLTNLTYIGFLTGMYPLVSD